MPRTYLFDFGGLEPTPDERRRKWASFGLGLLVEGLALGCLLLLGILFPAEIEQVAKRAAVYIQLATPSSPPEISAMKPPKPVVRLQAPKIPNVPPPNVAVPKLPPLPRPPEVVAKERPLFTPVLPTATPLARLQPPKPPVRTDVFGGSSQGASLKLPAREVQTGGFGDPDGLHGPPLGGSQGNMISTGSFELPSGLGHGNGTGGARGEPGTVASSGFGNGVAVAEVGGSQSGTRGVVRPSGFAAVEADPRVSSSASSSKSPLQPVEIISKPKPAYTDEARRMGVQGEVVLAVVFEASGKVRVLRVVQGLGHGLDEAASTAAGQIRFKPAQRDGQSVDFPATLRILFQLAG